MKPAKTSQCVEGDLGFGARAQRSPAQGPPVILLIVERRNANREIGAPGNAAVGRGFGTQIQWRWSGTSKQVSERKLFEPMMNL